MTTITATTATSTASGGVGTGYASLGEKDFLKMLTAELQNQDPTAPVDQKDMLGQMAQFSSLAGINTGNATLEQIADKLDTLIAAQKTSAAASAGSAVQGS